MRFLPLFCLLAALAPPLGASAALVRYAWTGFLEPGDAPGNPWSLAGDGLAATPGDGTPFSLEVFVDAAALDASPNPDAAAFVPSSAILLIGGSAAGLSNLDFRLGDDTFGTLDRIVFDAAASFLGTTLGFSTEVRVPIDTYALADTGLPDLPPTWDPVTPVQFGAFAGDIISAPANAPVTAEFVPEPGTAGLVGLGICALGARRRKRAR